MYPVTVAQPSPISTGFPDVGLHLCRTLNCIRSFSKNGTVLDSAAPNAKQNLFGGKKTSTRSLARQSEVLLFSITPTTMLRPGERGCVPSPATPGLGAGAAGRQAAGRTGLSRRPHSSHPQSWAHSSIGAFPRPDGREVAQGLSQAGQYPSAGIAARLVSARRNNPLPPERAHRGCGA